MHTEYRSGHLILLIEVSSVAMTTVTFQNGRTFTFNPIYLKIEFGNPGFLFNQNFFKSSLLLSGLYHINCLFMTKGFKHH